MDWEAIKRISHVLVQLGAVVSLFSVPLFTVFRWVDLREGRKNRKAMAEHRLAVEELIKKQVETDESIKTMLYLFFTHIQNETNQG